MLSYKDNASKKVPKLDPKQLTLFGVSCKSQKNESDTFEMLVNVSDSVSTESQETENEPDGRAKNVKVFQTEWLKYYSWLGQSIIAGWHMIKRGTSCTVLCTQMVKRKMACPSITEFQCLRIVATLGHNKHTFHYLDLFSQNFNIFSILLSLI